MSLAEENRAWIVETESKKKTIPEFEQNEGDLENVVLPNYNVSKSRPEKLPANTFAYSSSLNSHIEDLDKHTQEIVVEGSKFWYKKNSNEGTALIPKYGDLGLFGVLITNENGVDVEELCIIKYLETGDHSLRQNWQVMPIIELNSI